ASPALERFQRRDEPGGPTSAPARRFPPLPSGRFSPPRCDARDHRLMAGDRPSRPVVSAQHGIGPPVHRAMESSAGFKNSLEDPLGGHPWYGSLGAAYVARNPGVDSPN